MITYDSDWSTLLHSLYHSNNPNLTPALQALGTEIAQTALTDGAKGLAIDNEVSINSSTDLPTEQSFFESIVKTLSASNGNLFLFDANATAKALYPTYHNIVIMAPLYDNETVNSKDDITPTGSPNAYYDINTYQGPSTDKSDRPSVADSVFNALNLNVPVMFVLPASATQTLWSTTQLYNSPGSQGQPCEQPDQAGSVQMNVLSNFLCDQKTGCPTTATGGNVANVTAYLSPKNCAAYQNTSTLPGNSKPVMQQYFDTALAALKTNNASTNPHYIGVTLYTWRVPHYADYSCASKYYSQNAPDTIHPCSQVLPSDISSGIWADFQAWAEAVQ
jgi:hypothetical protein